MESVSPVAELGGWSVTFVWAWLFLWIWFTGWRCYFVVDIAHYGERIRWCGARCRFGSWRFLPIPISYQLFLRWLHPCRFFQHTWTYFTFFFLKNLLIDLFMGHSYFWMCSIAHLIQCDTFNASCCCFSFRQGKGRGDPETKQIHNVKTSIFGLVLTF